MAIGTLTAIGLAAAGGAGIAGAARGNRDKVQNDFLMNPEYAENKGARELWWKKLQDWVNDPNYGAIGPDWGNIWENFQNKVKQYYEGSPTAPGVKDRIKSSLARRGMSESPASDMALLRSDVEQGNTLADMATQQGIERARLAEGGRTSWLQSLQNLEAAKPQGQWQTTIKPDKTNQILSSIGSIGSSLAGYGIQNEMFDKQAALLKSLNHNNTSFGSSPWDASNSGFMAGIRRSSLSPNLIPAGWGH